VAIQLVKSREDAQEVVQDAFVKAYRHLGQFNRASRFSTWLYRIVYNTALTKLTAVSTGPAQQIELTDEALSSQEPEGPWLTPYQEEQLEAIRQAAGQLLPEEALLITLYYDEEQSITDISQIMSLSPSNVKVKLFRARKKILQLAQQRLDLNS
jgi:RNA polymerase sigma-70 factor (ECF subfamily)